jgi:hypothetical protein
MLIHCKRKSDDYVAEFVRHVNPRTAIKGSTTGQAPSSVPAS